jgi:secreted Zn-dependent insulinase-like peptidase
VSHLAAATDMFAQFFVSPLLTANSTDHELHAVDSENAKNLQVVGCCSVGYSRVLEGTRGYSSVL